jgi:hypothetical protein
LPVQKVTTPDSVAENSSTLIAELYAIVMFCTFGYNCKLNGKCDVCGSFAADGDGYGVDRLFTIAGRND